MTTRERAFDFWRRGLSIIPVPAPRPGALPSEPGGGKVPAISWRVYQQRLPTTDELDAWFPADCETNLAIVTGAVSSVVAVDTDSEVAVRWATRHLPYTPWQTQTASGFHLFYQRGAERVPNRARIETRDGRLALDVRGDGGYVIAPGSRHASGATYREAGDWREPREALPEFSAAWLRRPQQSRSVDLGSRRPSGDAVQRARRYLAAIPPPEIGHGSDTQTLYAACRLVRGFALSEADALSLLWEWAGGRPGWTLPWLAAKVRHASQYGSEPIGALVS